MSRVLSLLRSHLLLDLSLLSLQDIHPIHSFLAVPDMPARIDPTSIASPRLVEGASVTSQDRASSEDMRLAFLRARGYVGMNGVRRDSVESRARESREAAVRLPLKPSRHIGVICFGCLTEIVGARLDFILTIEI